MKKTFLITEKVLYDDCEECGCIIKIPWKKGKKTTEIPISEGKIVFPDKIYSWQKKKLIPSPFIGYCPILKIGVTDFKNPLKRNEHKYPGAGVKCIHKFNLGTYEKKGVT